MKTYIAKTVLVFILPLSFVAFAGCASDKQVMAQADDTHKALAPAVMNDAELNNYMQSIGERVIASASEMDKQKIGPSAHFKEQGQWMFSKNMKFHLVNSKTLNAFTTGGEHMYIYNALFQACKSEDELAAVMAHEYAHVYCRHVKSGMDRQVGQNVGTGAIAGAAGLATFFFGGGLSSS